MSLERKSLIDRTRLDGWLARNNDTHQNNTAEQAGNAAHGCIIMNIHLLCPKLTVPKGLRNTTESLKLLIHGQTIFCRDVALPMFAFGQSQTFNEP